MKISEEFQKRIEDYLDASEMSASRFGLEAMKDASFVFDIREGRACSVATVERVLDWIEKNPPAGEAA